MNRLERKLLRLTDELARLREQERLVAGELEMHRHLHEDAARDAAVHDTPVERENARDAAKDVLRFATVLDGTRKRIARIEGQRQRLLPRLG